MEEANKEILEIFRKLEVNISLFEAIKKIPKYAKFSNDLCTDKRQFKSNEWIIMGKNVSALIAKAMTSILKKCKDLETFTIHCMI